MRFSKIVLIFLIGFAISCSQNTENISSTLEPLTKGPKYELLKDLVGEHKLISIEGFTGANNLSNYEIQKGNWTASGSFITTDAQRMVAYDIDLSKEDLSKLQSMKIVVSEDLTVSLVCNSKEYFKTTFDEKKMGYFLKKPAKDYYSVVPESLKTNTTFIKDHLYFFASDTDQNIPYLDIAQVAADAAVLAYNQSKKEWELKLFHGDCCDQSNYIFKRK